ncbi:MAG: methyltransferase domain-containing protein [Gammaproteobacteria bacterium]|jgi:protein-L-isoaspartate(D-aspartate) O-methyltransferase|nr:methyltransferase domain-containing protein [Gammaproteobacteria bacterium]
MTAVDFAQARYNMVEQQVRPWDVLDQRVLDVMDSVPREHFTPAALRNLAYADIAIPLDDGQAMLHPKYDGRILQALAIGEYDNVLEIGTGSGYLTACLAALGRHVRSIDIRAAFTERAGEKLASRNVDNVTLATADLFAGGLDEGPGRYDAIAVGGSLERVPQALRDALSIDGRLFIVVGSAPVMEAQLITRVGPQEWTSEGLFDAVLPKLDNEPDERPFEF